MIRKTFPFVCLTLILGFATPVLCQPAMNGQSAMAERRLAEAESFFQQNDYQMGANRVVEACHLLRSSRGANSSVQVATSKVDFIDAKLTASLQRNDFDTARTLLGAEQTILTPLTNWEPQNPRWHYQKAKLFQAESRIPMTGNGAILAQRLGVPMNLHNEVNMQPLRNSIQECEQVMRMGDPSLSEAALKLKAACESEIQRRTGNMNKVHADYYRKLKKGVPPPGMYNNTPPPTEHYCSKCGGGHESWICPNTHGG